MHYEKHQNETQEITFVSHLTHMFPTTVCYVHQYVQHQSISSLTCHFLGQAAQKYTNVPLLHGDLRPALLLVLDVRYDLRNKFRQFQSLANFVDGLLN